MSLDLYLEGPGLSDSEGTSFNVTHNLGAMARLAGFYGQCWYPQDNGIVTASDLLPHLSEGLRFLVTHPKECEALNPDNGWGSYPVLVEFVSRLAIACARHPDAVIKAWA